MILVSVGTQFPFTRLIRAVDDWAGVNGRDDVVAQVGSDKHAPAHIKSFQTIAPADFRRMQEEAAIFVSHAGMGSILTALELAKPIVIMPRKAALGEHRNDHQIDTARRFSNTPGIYVADDETELAGLLEKVQELQPPARSGSSASFAMVEKLREYIDRL